MAAATIDLTNLSDSDTDELNMMKAPIMPNHILSSANPIAFPSSIENASAPSLGRTMRPRISVVNTSVPITKERKRPRAISTGGGAENNVPDKKQKSDDRKAATDVVNKKRQNVDLARKQWLLRHRHVFEPLLPKSSSKFWDNIEGFSAGNASTYVPLHQLDEQPKLITGGHMKDYQLQGLSFLVWMYRNGMNCILGDEMGLGKTLQTLSLFAYIKENSPGHVDPHLVICPLSVLSSWQSEAERWLPSMRVLRIHGSEADRKRVQSFARDFEICITTYEAYSSDPWFKTRRWMYCVLDEGHRIKNSGTLLAHKLQGIGPLYRLLLTGTPVQNNLLELWGLLHWLYPTVFTAATESGFQQAFNLSRGSYSIPFLTAAQKLLSTIMIRRTKAVVEQSVPPREELTVFLPFTEAQRFWTYRLLTRMDTLDLQQIFTVKLEDNESDQSAQGRKELQTYLATQMTLNKSGQQNQWTKLMNLLMQLRKVCDHPYLLKDAEPDPYGIGEHVVAASSKLIAIDKLLKDLLPKGERVLIFSQWTSMLDLLEDFMALRNIKYGRLDGSTPRSRRSLYIKLFQQQNSAYQVFLLSTKAGALGINLTAASCVIMCDSDWNPQNDLQAIARAHRIGQTKTVKVYRLICQGSVEDQMLDRIRRKLFLSLKVMSSDSSSTGDNTGMDSAELRSILRKGSSALNSGIDLAHFLAAPITETLQASRAREDAREAKVKNEVDHVKMEDRLLADAEEEELRLLQGVAQVQSRLFEGQIHAKKDNKEIAGEWNELQKRTRTSRLVMVDGMAFQPDHNGPAMIPEIMSAKPVEKRKGRKYEHEDWCIHCRDGGELVLCSGCPRVFHADCAGLSKAEVRRGMLYCHQHSCAVCNRSGTDAGGMLFRCQTCPQAFCEDCLPEGDLDTVGEVLPEFILVGFREISSAYFIRCHDCHQRFEEEPSLWESWQQEMRETQEKLNMLSA